MKTKSSLKPRYKIHVKKGQEVIVISGANKNKKGKVLEVLTKKDRVIVEGVNMISKAVRPTQKNPKGGFEKREGSIHVSNVMDVKEYERRFEKRRVAKK